MHLYILLPGGEQTLVVHSSCPMSEDLKEELKADMKEYAYIVFSLFTDIVDRVLKRLNVVAVISGNVPTLPGNTVVLTS